MVIMVTQNHNTVFSTFWFILSKFDLIVAIAMDGRALTPLLNCLNCCSVRTSQVGSEVKPSYSSEYASSQMTLSIEFRDESDFKDEGAIRDVSP
jgi:hypothetical protein